MMQYLFVWYVALVDDQIYFYQHDCMHRLNIVHTCFELLYGYVKVFNIIIYMYTCIHIIYKIYCMSVYLLSNKLFMYVLFEMKTNKIMPCCFTPCSYHYLIAHNILIELMCLRRYYKTNTITNYCCN